MVERQPRKGLADLRSADDGRDLIGRKQTGEQIGQKVGRARRQLGRLEHDAIAGRERRDKRHDREVERIVPRTDDADDADRLIKNAGRRRRQFQPDGYPLRPHPAGKMAQRVADRRLRRKDFAEFGFVARTIAEIGRDRRGQPIVAAADRVAEFLQIGAPLLQRRRSGAQERRPLRVENAAHARHAGQCLVHSGGRSG